jgi:RNA polymerase sigma-70 factor, ECF subfamily
MPANFSTAAVLHQKRMDSDERLFERLREGDLAAFDVLYARHAARLLGFVRAYLRDLAESEDVLHETFMALLEPQAVDFKLGSFRSWLYQVARNRSLNRLRSQKRGAAALDQVAAVPVAPVADAERAMAGRQAAEALRAAVDRLPHTLSEVFHLRAQGMSYDEMSLVLAIPVGTVKSRMHEMVSCLKQEMAPWTAP